MSVRAQYARSVWRPVWTLIVGLSLVVPNCGLREGIVSHCASAGTCCCGTGGACCKNGQCPNRSAPSTTAVAKPLAEVLGAVKHAPPAAAPSAYLLTAAELPAAAALLNPDLPVRPTLRTLNARINV